MCWFQHENGIGDGASLIYPPRSCQCHSSPVSKRHQILHASKTEGEEKGIISEIVAVQVCNHHHHHCCRGPCPHSANTKNCHCLLSCAVTIASLNKIPNSCKSLETASHQRMCCLPGCRRLDGIQWSRQRCKRGGGIRTMWPSYDSHFCCRMLIRGA